MRDIFFEGLFFGLILSFSLGPVLFTIIETAISYGSKKAMGIAVGVLLSDVSIVLMCSFFSNKFSDLSVNFVTIKLVTGFAFIMMGIYKLAIKTKQTLSKIKSTHPGNFIQFIFKGIFVNSLNPGIYVLWMSLISLQHSRYDLGIFWFFCGVFTITFSLDLIKSHFAGRLDSFLTHKNRRNIMQISGVIFILFGLFILFKSQPVAIDISSFSFRHT